MSVLKTCPYCGGHGSLQHIEPINAGYRGTFKECIACKGTGTILFPETNADRIRSMSDEELAIALVKHEGTEKRRTPCGGHEHIFYGPNGEKCGSKAEAVGMWFVWLSKPAEED